MTIHLWLEDLTPYTAAHALQEQLVAARSSGSIPDVILTLEHPPTITVGRRRDAARNVLGAGEVPVVQVERGGDATYHAPGQLVAYPIIQLEGARRDLRGHLHRLEAAVIKTIEACSVTGFRDPRNTGVWVRRGEEEPQKVCSIGVACRNWVTWHGLALNVDVDLMGFSRINPCGFGASIMTRLRDHAARYPSLDDLRGPLARHLTETLKIASPTLVVRSAPMDEQEASDLSESIVRWAQQRQAD